MSTPVPVLGLAAGSGTGKTTLLRKLIPLLKAHGLRIGLIKRAHHTFDTDKPGKDSYELRKAGAAQVLVGSDRTVARRAAAKHNVMSRDLSESAARVTFLARDCDDDEPH